MARKILLADDSVTAQNMGRKILADAGYEVSTVNNGSAALKRVAELRPDVIVLDVYMPGYSGLEVCTRLKEASETARIPILLTVGKLEPFKPEEAKRARADAYIVKPFEASELLAALSKLEDKIVPRAESSKPGRFARAIAAVEEGRYDKSMAIEEDSGWKQRISFPSKKKKKAKEEGEDVDDPALYNPVNKDLRTTVEHKPAPTPPPASPEDTRVDLGALAVQGLPQDVTPQEIAALAAAAARIQDAAGEKPQTQGPVSEKQPAEAPVPETRIEQPAPEPKAVAELAAKAPDKETEKQEEKVEAKPEPAEISKETASPVVEAVAEQTAEPKEKEKVEAPAEKPAEAASIAPGMTSSIDPDLTGAIAAMPLGTYVSLAPSSGNGSSSSAPEPKSEPEPEPVTMAVAAGAESAGSASRWMAVPVALLPEEAAISLELEMQKAHAAFAAAEAAHAAPVQATADAPLALVEPAPATEISAPVAASVPEPVVPFDAPPVPSLMQTISAVASEAKEAIRAAVKEFESVASSFVKEETPAPAEPEPAPAVAAEAKPEPEPEPAPAVAAEAKPEPEPETAPAVAAEAKPEPAASMSVEAKAEPIPVVEEAKPEPTLDAVVSQDTPQPVPQEPPEQKKEEVQPAAEAVAAAPEISPKAETPETAAPVVNEVPAEPVSAPQDSPQVTEVSAQADPDAGGNDYMAKKENEMAATTAAAWASWRRIRESGDTKGHAAPEAEPEAPKEEAAMAVAAGAEKAPEEVSPEGESDEIASIVDSVLADMRPKIVQEISKKLGKKKK